MFVCLARQVKVLYVRNLKSDVTEAMLRSEFEAHGAVEKVKKVKDYGFVHFAEREFALAALNALNGTVKFCTYWLIFTALHYSAKFVIAIACRLSIRLSVCLSVRDIRGSWRHGLEILEINCTGS